MKKLLLISILALFILSMPVSATINVTAAEVSTNYIKWTWPDGTTATGINVDGKLISTFDPSGSYYILSNLNPDELHQITVYTSGDVGTNTTYTNEEPAGDTPLGLWIYGIPALLFVGIARYAKIAFLHLGCAIFGLFGLFQLLVVKTALDTSMWTLSMIIYTILIFVGFTAYAFQTGRLS